MNNRKDIEEFVRWWFTAVLFFSIGWFMAKNEKAELPVNSPPHVAFESRSYPILTPESTPSNAPAPGYMRRALSWSAQTIDSTWVYDYGRKTGRIVLCVIPEGSATFDEPSVGQPIVGVILCLGGRKCDLARHEIWSVYRGAEDWRNWVGCRMLAPGQPRTLALYPTHGETIIVRRTE